MEITDADRVDWLERHMRGGRVLFSISRKSGLASLKVVRGDTRGSHSVREAVDVRIQSDRRRELGFKR